MTSIASTGAAPVGSAPATDPVAVPAERQTPLERLLAEPGLLDRFAAPDAAPPVADAEHGAAPLR